MFKDLSFNPMTKKITDYNLPLIVKITPRADESVHYLGAYHEESLGPGRYQLILNKHCLCCNKQINRFYKIAWAYNNGKI